MTLNLLNKIKLSSTFHFLPNRTYYKVISSENVKKIASNFNVSSLKIEIIAIENKIVPDHYLRNMNFLSFHDQLKLLNTRVCIVGLGGLGGIVLENLARIGIGELRLIDGDVFENHNLNRQILSSNSEIGNFKTDTAIKRILKINPSILVIAFKKYLTEFNSEYLIDNCDIVVDCLDNINSRFVLESECKKKNLPLVSAAIAGAIGHITTIYPHDKGLELIFGKRKNILENKGKEVIMGCPAPSVTTIASIESNEVIKLALGKTTLRNKLLVIDMEDYTFEIVNLK